MIIKILSLYLSVTAWAHDNSPLEMSCDQVGGQIVSSYICPQSGVKREGRFCLLPDSGAFYNGCTGGAWTSGFSGVFFNACLKHDFCYHHEPSSNNVRKRNCDDNFYEDLLDICNGTQGGSFICKVAAQSFFRAVRLGGGASWRCSDIKLDTSTLIDQGLLE